MQLHRRTLLIAGAAIPFLGREARAVKTPGQLIFGLSSYPPSMAPWANAGTAAATAKLMVHRGLLGYAPDGSIRGELAESWERDGDTAWVFKLRDATFHNGAKLTSADVKWTVDQVAAEKSTAFLRTEMQRIERVETPDPRTARIITKAPSATLPLLFASYFLPICANGTADMGAGPFVLKGQERGNWLEFEAFDKFYRPGNPKLKKVRMVAYADENLRAAALQAGDVDLIEYVPWQSMQAIDDDPRLKLDATEGPFMYVTFNGKSGPFADHRVRQAVAHGIRREEIVKAAFFGRGAPILGLPIKPSKDFPNFGDQQPYKYDPAKAKALLAQAGHPNGFNTKLLATAQYGMHKDTAQVVQQHLAEIGIQAELQLPDWATRVSLGNRGQYEFSINGTAAESNDPDGMAPFLSTGLAPSYTRSLGLEIPGLNEKLAAGRAEFDKAKRQAIYEGLEKLALEQAPIVGLCWRSQGYGYDKGVTGFHNIPGALTFYSGTTLEDTATG